MQKLREWIEKDKDPEEIIQDLSKSYSKSIPKQLEILHEFLEYHPSWNFDPSDPLKCRDKIQRLGLYLKKTVTCINSGSYSLDFSTIEPTLVSIINHKWSASHPLIPSYYESLKKLILEVISIFFKQLIKIIGPSCIHPKILKLVKAISINCGPETYTNSLLINFLEAIGSSGTDFVYEYFQKYEIIQTTIEELEIMTREETVTLGLCKKDKKKKIGNAHQRRHHKVVMKITENKILKNMTEVIKERHDINVILSNIKLIIQYLISSPVEKLPLEALMTLQIHKLSVDLQYTIIQLMFYYSISTRKHIKKVKTLLQNFIKNIEYRNICRHYLFLLENIL